MAITLICAWCGKVIFFGKSQLVSHGICKKCLEKELKSM